MTKQDLRLLTCCVSVALIAWPSAPIQAQFQKQYEIVTIADDVFAIIWQDITQYPFEGNHLVVINDDDVFVVDANRTPSLADTVIAIVRRHTQKPIRYVVNTHWHADHVQGNAVYRRELPEVMIIGHPETVTGIDTVLVPYIDEVRRDVAAARTQLAADATVDGEPFTDAQRKRAEGRLESLEREETLYEAVELARPNVLVSDSMTIDGGDRQIKIFHPGPANTSGDLVVYIPEAGVLAVGDLVTKPFPLLGWDSPGSWSRALDHLLGLDPQVVIPGHGELMRSMEYVELFRDLFRALSTQVRDGVERGRSLEELQTTIDLEHFWREFAGDNERLFQGFAAQFQPRAVERAYLELTR